MFPRRALILVAFLNTSCVRGGLSLSPGPIRFYEGPEQAPEYVAVIENDRTMFFESLDGRDLGRWTQTREVVRFQVLPGTHVVVAGPSERAGVVSTEAVRVEFRADAGHRYVISRRLSGGSSGGAWQPILTDVTPGRRQASVVEGPSRAFWLCGTLSAFLRCDGVLGGSGPGSPGFQIGRAHV